MTMTTYELTISKIIFKLYIEELESGGYSIDLHIKHPKNVRGISIGGPCEYNLNEFKNKIEQDYYKWEVYRHSPTFEIITTGRFKSGGNPFDISLNKRQTKVLHRWLDEKLKGKDEIREDLIKKIFD